jgi:hypothetical protein
MTELVITDKSKNINNLFYLQKTLAEILGQTESSSFIESTDNESTMRVLVKPYYEGLIKEELADKIAEVIAIAYKYEFFVTKIKPSGLKESEIKLLLAGIISADFEDDKKYIIDKIGEFKSLSIDGTFNFKLKILKDKWAEICTVMPSVFTSEQLKEFLLYISGEKDKKIFVDGDGVYDCHYRRLLRSELLGEHSVLVETILSGAYEINYLSMPSINEQGSLKEYYGSRITFLKSR